MKQNKIILNADRASLTMTEKLPSLRREDTDHQIKLEEVNEKEPKVP